MLKIYKKEKAQTIVFPSQLQEDTWPDGGSKLLLGKLLFRKKISKTMNMKLPGPLPHAIERAYARKQT